MMGLQISGVTEAAEEIPCQFIFFAVDGGQNGMSNREGRRSVSDASGAGVIKEHASPCETDAGLF
jgi:hypothetical protein